MSKNSIFGPQTGPAPDFLRNTYDKQFQKLITTDFGDLRPCFCKEVLPGDSLKIDPMVAIRSHPIVFPINTRIKFYCHFFYGRNRILYKDFEDFIFNTREGLTPPFLKLTHERAKKMISTNSLGDNLGIPSTYNPDSSVSVGFNFERVSYGNYGNNKVPNVHTSFEALSVYVGNLIAAGRPLDPTTEDKVYSYCIGYISDSITSSLFSSVLRSPVLTSLSDVYGDISDCAIVFCNSQNVPVSVPYRIGVNVSAVISSSGNAQITLDLSNIPNLAELTKSYVDDLGSYKIFFCSYKNRTQTNSYPDTNEPLFRDGTSPSLFPESFSYEYIPDIALDATDDLVISQNKFVGENPVIPLSSLAMRLYEFCCNYYYRNDQNNPYILDGVPQYNKFIPTDEGGWDTNEYLIHKRNWESDPFTTAVPSPQYGTAPLVGLTYSGGDTARVITNVTDSDGNTKQLGITVGVDEEGTLTSVMQVDTGVPSGSLRRLMDGVDGIRLGMSINDLRNVNSFQRFLENVIRRGLRYRNQLLSHFGVSVDYPDIDIPQFIGGFSGDLTVMEVTNMAESADVALGDVAGKINAVISSNHSISIYCPEHGFVMGIFSIVPVPTYSQILPTMFTRYSYLDYFQKEFDKIGYVPIFHRNFLPLQSDDPNKILGYQRAWWDYMCSFDEVNGDFRTTLADFVLYRQFKEVPTLNEEFLKVDSESLNNIFAVDKVDEKYLNSKKFMCQFYFQYSHKNMVSKFGVASLE